MLGHPDNADIVAALADTIASGTVLHYTLGNHDFDLPDTLFRTWFRATQMGDNFTLGLVWGEHGHRFDLFNASPDPLNLDPAKGHRPLGYYITRVHTHPSSTKALGISPLNSSAYIRAKVAEAREEIIFNTARSMSKWTVATLVLQYVMRDAGVTYEDTIKMPDGQEVTLQQVSDAYQDLFHNWEKKHGLLSAFNAVLAACDSLDASAQQIRDDHGKRIVALGHSHIAKWNPDTLEIGNRGVTGAYVNDGAGCKWPQTAVIVDYLPDTFKVHRLSWDGPDTSPTEDVEELLNTWK